MDKWTGIAVVTMFIFVFGGMAVDKWNQSNADIKMAQAGLEECPKNGYGSVSSQTIWVKSCKEYLEGKK
jgi:hypothetical protein